MKFLKKFFKGIFSGKGSKDEKLKETPPSTKNLETKPPEKRIDQGPKEKASAADVSNKRPSKPKAKQQPHEERDLVVGFDFGTSFTKVIVRDTAVNKSHAIKFNGIVSDDNEYLLPTRIFFNDDSSQYSLTEGDIEYSDLKLKMMDEDTQQEIKSKLHVACFIGLTLREVIKRFLREHKAIYMSTTIVWNLNLGIPSRWFDNDDLVCIFKHVGYAGWIISEDNGAVTASMAEKALNEASNILQQSVPLTSSKNYNLHFENLYITPEIIAEVVGYSKSYLRNYGLHGIIDIGAGTFDISTFVLHGNREGDLFSILRSEVRPFGVLKYEEANGEGNQSLDNFIKNCKKLIQIVFMETYKDGDPNSPSWANGLPLFICGGGSKVKIYELIISESETTLKGAVHFKGFKSMELPPPNDLEVLGLPPNLYHRLAVAYGLSHTSWSIGYIRPPSSIEDITGPSNTPSNPYKPIKPSTQKYQFDRNKKYEDKERG
jgi:hypothetical protein